jgi:ribosomal protein S18 acetylase RimI-like enzyme
MAPVQIKELTLEMWPQVLALMGRTPGICVREADSAERVAAYLERNPGMSFAALHDGRVVGCAMCGHDGRRGYLHHVVVEPEHRRAGVATALVERCLGRLGEAGIAKCHLDVLTTNEQGKAFWARRGWRRRDDVQKFSIIMSAGPNA